MPSTSSARTVATLPKTTPIPSTFKGLEMRIRVHFYSYFKELTGCAETAEEMPRTATVQDLLASLHERFPKLAAMTKSTLVAVGVEYQTRSYPLKDGDEGSLL